MVTVAHKEKMKEKEQKKREKHQNIARELKPLYRYV